MATRVFARDDEPGLGHVVDRGGTIVSRGLLCMKDDAGAIAGEASLKSWN